jgi:hypothetical protein
MDVSVKTRPLPEERPDDKRGFSSPSLTISLNSFHPTTDPALACAFCNPRTVAGGPECGLAGEARWHAVSGVLPALTGTLYQTAVKEAVKECETCEPPDAHHRWLVSAAIGVWLA